MIGVTHCIDSVAKRPPPIPAQGRGNVSAASVDAALGYLKIDTSSHNVAALSMNEYASN